MTSASLDCESLTVIFDDNSANNRTSTISLEFDFFGNFGEVWATLLYFSELQELRQSVESLDKELQKANKVIHPLFNI